MQRWIISIPVISLGTIRASEAEHINCRSWGIVECHQLYLQRSSFLLELSYDLWQRMEIDGISAARGSRFQMEKQTLWYQSWIISSTWTQIAYFCNKTQFRNQTSAELKPISQYSRIDILDLISILTLISYFSSALPLTLWLWLFFCV